MFQGFTLKDGWLQVLNSSNEVILWSEHKLINGAVSNGADGLESSYWDFIDIDLPVGEQLRIQQSSGTTVTITLTIECIEGNDQI